MRPPMASDHVVENKLRVLYTKKHAPYNSGEERTVAASIARRLCVLGVCIPSLRKEFIYQVDPNSGDRVKITDEFGGWALTDDENAIREKLELARKEQAGDFKDELDDQELARREEEARVEEQNQKKAEVQAGKVKVDEKKKKGGFLKGGKGATGEEAKG